MTSKTFFAFDVEMVPGIGFQPVDLTRNSIREISEQEAADIDESHDVNASEQTWVYLTREDAMLVWRKTACI